MTDPRDSVAILTETASMAGTNSVAGYLTIIVELVNYGVRLNGAYVSSRQRQAGILWALVLDASNDIRNWHRAGKS